MTIEQLASQKDFTALSATERALVLAEMSQEAYQQLRQLLITTRQLDASAMPPAILRAKLISQMRQRPQPKGMHRWLTVQVPLWQAAAVMLFLVSMVALRKPTVVVEKPITAWQVRVDTIFQEKVLWRDRVVVKNKVIYQDRTPEAPMANMPDQLHTVASMAPEIQVPEWSDTHMGTTLGDTPEWMGFFTQGDK